MNEFPGPAVAILVCTITLLWLVVRGACSRRPRPAAVEAPAKSDRWSPAVRVALFLFVLWLITDIIAISLLQGPKQPTFRTVGDKGELPAVPHSDVRPEGEQN